MSTFALLLTAAALTAPPDFDTQILPVLTRAGCNSGACHGAAAGRGGFRLSLWGSDPEADHHAIVHELEGRRVNLAHPAESLLLLKPMRQVPHEGGQRLQESTPGVQLLLAWLKEGAPRGSGRQLRSLTVTPPDRIVDAPGAIVPISVRATFAEQDTVDVTPWTVFTSPDPASVTIDGDGRARVLRRGQHTVLLRYLGETRALRLTLPLGEQPIDLAREPRQNFIDAEILQTLEALRVRPEPRCADATFLRRVSLDLTGTLPAPEQVIAFLQDTNPRKRTILIDQLLAAPKFVDYRTLLWGRLLRISSRGLGEPAARVFHDWLRTQVARNAPLDQVVRELVTADGDSRRYGPASFSRIPVDPRQHAEYVSQLFLGARLRCANCHNHPLDRWTQDDYHGLAAVFASLERGAVVRLGPKGEVIHPRSGEPAIPRLPGERFLEAAGDQRRALVTWLTDPANPYFARAIVNRLWKEMMGRGLVEPVDDLRATNPATHPQLLDRLAQDFVQGGYDVRRTLRLIANSAAYQRAAPRTPANGGLDRFYAYALTKPLEAEVLADALANVTGVADRYGDLPAGTRAVTLHDPQIPAASLDILGRCSRTGSCDEEATRSGGLARTLHLINGAVLNRKIASPEGRLHQLLKQGKTNDQILAELTLRALGRPPAAAERAAWLRELAAAATEQARLEVLEDWFWAVLSGREFTSNH